jgi:EF hand domain-containing protein
MKKLALISVVIAAGCQTANIPETAGPIAAATEEVTPVTTSETVIFDAAEEKEIGEKVGYIFAAPEKVYVRIGREFPAFDSDYNGELDAYEFGKWLIPLRELRAEFDSTELNISDEELIEWSKRAHAFADADANGEVSYKELATYFGGI